MKQTVNLISQELLLLIVISQMKLVVLPLLPNIPNNDDGDNRSIGIKILEEKQAIKVTRNTVLIQIEYDDSMENYGIRIYLTIIYHCIMQM